MWFQHSVFICTTTIFVVSVVFHSYDDLRPPVSPTPTPPDGQKNKNVIDAVSKLENPDTQTGAMGTTTTITEIKPAPPEISIKKALSPYVA